MKRTQRQVWLSWIALLIWMGLVFSASTDAFSASHTSRFIEPFLRWLFHGRLGDAGIDEAHFLIRKLGHLCEYAVLAVLAWNALRLSATDASGGRRLTEGKIFGLAEVVAVVYAAGDEFHQSFVPSREASVRDVCIDAVGAAIGLLLLRVGRTLKRRWAEKLRPGIS